MTKKTRHIHKARPSMQKRVDTGLRVVHVDSCRCGAQRITAVSPEYAVGPWAWNVV